MVPFYKWDQTEQNVLAQVIDAVAEFIFIDFDLISRLFVLGLMALLATAPSNWVKF